MPQDTVLERILSRMTEGKIIIWLWRHPGWHEVQEISQAHPLLSEKRIYQVVKNLRENNCLQTTKRQGRYQYRLSRPLRSQLENGMGNT